MVLIPHKPMTHVPPGYYLGMITKIEEVEERYGLTLNVVAEIKEGEHKGKEVAGYFRPKISKKSKMGKLARVILGPGATTRDVDSDELLNVLCYLKIEDHEIEEDGTLISKLVGAKKYEPGTPTD